MNDPLRVGMIGVGWGSVVQVPAFRMVPQFEVAALCSRRADRVQAAGEKLGVADVSTHWQAFVARDDLDLISVCTPVDPHHEQAEKPVGLDSGQTAEMLAAAEAAGVCHAVCFESRWEPARCTLWEMVKAGHLGQPHLALARSGGDFWHESRGLQSEWMYKKSEGGGYLMGMGSHDIDFACALFGEPEAVCADVRTSVPRRTRPDGSVLEVDADDTSVLAMRMQNRMLVSVITTAIAFQRNFRAFEVYGSAGSLAVNGRLMAEREPDVIAGSVGRDAPEIVHRTPRRAASGAEPPQRRAGASILALALMLEDWLPAFSGGMSGAPNLGDGHRVQRVVDAARRSAAGEGWVAL